MLVVPTTGMKMGSDLLTSRQTHNPISCMFLLTDGIDNSNSQAKKDLAASLRVQVGL